MRGAAQRSLAATQHSGTDHAHTPPRAPGRRPRHQSPGRPRRSSYQRCRHPPSSAVHLCAAAVAVVVVWMRGGCSSTRTVPLAALMHAWQGGSGSTMHAATHDDAPRSCARVPTMVADVCFGRGGCVCLHARVLSVCMMYYWCSCVCIDCSAARSAHHQICGRGASRLGSRRHTATISHPPHTNAACGQLAGKRRIFHPPGASRIA
jgi:hypothetical protein